MKYKHKKEIEEKFFGYELNATSLEKYNKYRFFDINRVAMILFLFSRMPTKPNNRDSLEALIPNSILVYSSHSEPGVKFSRMSTNSNNRKSLKGPISTRVTTRVNYVPTLIINISFNTDSLSFYYNRTYTIH